MKRKPAPPIFVRSPRLRRQRVSPVEVEIHSPPKAPSKPQVMNLMASAIPLGLTVAVLLVVGILFNMGSFLLFSVPMMLATVVGTWYVYRMQRREYERLVVEREQKYLDYLRRTERDLNRLVRKAQESWRAQYPRPEKCLEIVAARHRDLWSRQPADDDFLCVRVGLGERPVPAEFKLPDQDPFDPDPLVEQAYRLVERYRTVHDVPVWLDVRQGGVVGLAGPHDDVMDLVRAVVVQLATYHVPTELKLGAFFDQHFQEEWAWMRWLPHTWDDDRQRRFLAPLAREGGTSELSPAELGDGYKRPEETLNPEAHNLLNRLDDLLSRRARFQKESRDENVSAGVPLVLFLHLDEPETVSPVIVRLMEEGPQLNIYPVFVAPRVKQLPHACRLLVRVPDPGDRDPAALWFAEEEHATPFSPDAIPVHVADTFARTMAPLRLRQGAQEADIPSLVTLFDLLGIHHVDEWPLEQMWARTWQRAPDDRRVPRHLAAPIGVGVGAEPLVIDLHEREHGPNGLVAGMVGAGKSELLQTLVISMALHYHPHRLAFVLIDYKGGGMADPLKGLPHVVGIITNLQEGNLAVRAITSLNVELRRRQELFQQAGVNHIDDYQRLYNEGKVKEPLPYLAVIVDEFAEMKTERPEVAQEFVRIARLGRALGFRLILAMQKPAGIVDGQIEANTRFRLCLRVAQTEDSQAMLKRPDAAYLQHIGRAIFQVGVNEIFETFQVAWSGAPAAVDEDPTRHPHSIVRVDLDGARHVLYTPGRTDGVQDEQTQLEVAVAFVRGQAERMGVEPLPSLWLPPLPEYLPLAAVYPQQQGWDGHTWRPVDRWLEPIVGLLDAPDERKQAPLTLPVGSQGHVLVCSAPGYGKTTFVQTLVASLALDHRPDEVNVYVLDFGGRGLGVLESFPHVGSVIYGDEDERVRRLMRYLGQQLSWRQHKMGEVNAPSLRQYVVQTKEQVPAIVVIVDTFTGLNEAYNEDDRFMEQLSELLREGPGAGIYFVFTANSSMDMRYKMRSSIGVNVALYLADQTEYGSLLRNTSVTPSQVRGRGVLDGPVCHEFQTALPIWGRSESVPMADTVPYAIAGGDGTGIFNVSAELRQLGERMAAAWEGPLPHSIRTMPEMVGVDDVVPAERLALHEDKFVLPVGLEFEDLNVVTLDFEVLGSLLIVGSAQSGKTTAVQTLLLLLASLHWPEHVRLFVFDSERQELGPLVKHPVVEPFVERYTCSEEDAKEAIEALRDLVEVRRQSARATSGEWPWVVAIVEDAFGFEDGVADIDKDELGRVAVAGLRQRFRLVVSAPAKRFRPRSFDGVLTDYQNFLILGTLEESEFSLGVEIPPPLKRQFGYLPPGDALFFQRGRYQRVRLATWRRHGDQLEHALREWQETVLPRFRHLMSPDPPPDGHGEVEENVQDLDREESS